MKINLLILIVFINCIACLTCISQNNELFEAVTDNDMLHVQSLVNKGADINAKNKSGTTCLEIACRRGDYDMAKYLTINGAEINDTLLYNRTCLMYALRSNNFDLINYLVNEGANINVIDDYGEPTIFHLYTNHKIYDSTTLKTVKLFEKHEADLMQTGRYGVNFLMKAASFHDTLTIRYLLEKMDFKITSLGRDSTTIIDYFSNDKEFLKYLLTKYPRTPNYKRLYVVSAMGINLEVISYLLDSLKVVNIDDTYNGRTALMNINGSYNGIAEYLVTKGININAQNKGVTALMLACSRRNFELVKLLVQNDVDINAKDNYNWTALDWLIDYNKNSSVDELVKFLESNGAKSGGKLKKEKPVIWN